MSPTLVRAPFSPPWRDLRGEGRTGIACLAYKDGARVRLVSRNDVDHTRRFGSIALAISKLSARTAVLDGEVAIFDRQLRSRFDWLREPDPDAIATPPMFMVFDLLHRDGRELTGRPLRDCRPGLRTPWPTTTWSFRYGGSRRTACRRGRRWLSAATRAELDAFFTEHRLCDDLDAGVDGPPSGFPTAAASVGPASNPLCGCRRPRSGDQFLWMSPPSQ